MLVIWFFPFIFSCFLIVKALFTEIKIENIFSERIGLTQFNAKFSVSRKDFRE